MRKKLSLLVAIALFLLAFGLYVLVFRFVIVEFLLRLVIDGPKAASKYLLDVATSIDQTANVTYPTLRTLLFIKWWDCCWYPFGMKEETISAVIAVNKDYDRLSWLGELLYRILETLDPGHAERAKKDIESKIPRFTLSDDTCQ